MKIGYLRVGFVPEDLQAEYGDYFPMFQALLRVHAPDIELRLYEIQHGEWPASVDECDGYLCPGATNSVYENLPWMPPLVAFVQEVYRQKVPFVGICFGHQLIAHALGGEVKRAETGWGLGVRTLMFKGKEPWMDGDAEQINLCFTHQDQVINLPPGGRIIASADHCPIAALTVDDHLIGFQGHPEISPVYLRTLMRSRVSRIGGRLLGEAEQTLMRPTGHRDVMRWIGRFFWSRSKNREKKCTSHNM
ncbi:MAG: gamma-glutamyl-gamma-aminobutyrate hydrolase family protein [Magnetococcales bacterium]|nr:gamma-glutamyl-gamma-aminobutyrate hydrolase family protein [Magnetococcales bacterium]